MQIYGDRSSELKKLHKNEVTRFMDSLGDQEAQEKYVQICWSISGMYSVTNNFYWLYGQMSHWPDTCMQEYMVIL